MGQVRSCVFVGLVMVALATVCRAQLTNAPAAQPIHLGKAQPTAKRAGSSTQPTRGGVLPGAKSGAQAIHLAGAHPAGPRAGDAAVSRPGGVQPYYVQPKADAAGPSRDAAPEAVESGGGLDRTPVASQPLRTAEGGGSAGVSQGRAVAAAPAAGQTIVIVVPPKSKKAAVRKASMVRRVPPVKAGPPLVVEPAVAMTDAEGRPLLDPDGKPMFHPAVFQQRDKHGRPLFDADHKPVMQTASELGYDQYGKKLRPAVVKQEKPVPIAFSTGTFTVDGFVAKTTCAYNIAALNFLYIFVPGVGTTLISNEPFAGSTMQAHAFDAQKVTVHVEGHMLQLWSEDRVLTKRPGPAYVRVDRYFQLASKKPMIGYGSTQSAPYAWPKLTPVEDTAGSLMAGSKTTD